MNLRTFTLGLGLLLVGLGAGLWSSRWLPHGASQAESANTAAAPASATASAAAPASRQVLYWANPMNAAIHADHPMKDNMGMDYVPVYAPAAAPQRRVLYWASPMNPAIHADHPMKDNMGMDYVPVYAQAETGGADTGVHIDPRLTQNLGVRLTTAQMRPLGQAIQTVGTVAVDQNRVTIVTPRFSGWVVQLKVRAVGDAVARGQVLAEIYSPELYAAQQEYSIARQLAGTTDSHTGSHPDNQGLLAAAKQRLLLLGLPEAALKQLEASGQPMRDVPILAPESGVVTALNIRQGSYVSSQNSLFEIANLDRVWVNVALYDYQMPWVRLGDGVQLQLPAYPGRNWDGRLNFLYPTLDPQTRTITARLSFANPGGMLRPGMYANATVQAQAQTALALPSSAVLRTQDGDYAMLAQAGGHFLPVQVALGPEANGWVVIARGLKVGDQVVESAQFLLYSESQFQSVKARMLGGQANTSGASGMPATGAMSGMPPASSPQAGAAGPMPAPTATPPVRPAAAPPDAGSMAGMNMAPGRSAP
ncbi:MULTISPECIES: efflux RND transporter periplasmic adaptor subunit [Thiomonas]|jgi:Cu(I)/Ag(I) efflux system membrane fusion protein|uniref:RND family efflux transporter, MFP subunit n=1 Tax=Thiomonas bhubaneswarensis TaxID=339866 RepID=A0A0K6ICC8_9BURK|nr:MULTISPECIES: efflux RND transporter periplasmic adaptor subunit [Thiomonas]MDE2254496.1 efflux RND transporter periplasmic adaptor subunit [Betaproteobacteria bacterium]OZB55708.1 MAG: efflux transporter periplasmic adaptor subunit [Thiomonas sp. 15-63-373]CUB00775.1 RND family efflux transporter, MFP subunit [Thiomonas bhubaneswarensis]HML81426.1 efflux RND transporter periplasmic adaptor subunit [Thiomonas arsenitoxydans]